MTLVRFALRRPVTILAMVVACVLAATAAIRLMPRDILPSLGVPVIYIAQPYGGMDPAQMEGYLTYYYEYHFLYVTGIEHVESKSVQGMALVKLQFHPGTDMAQALAETINYANRARAFMPPGTVPPFVMRFDAGSVPVGNLVFSSATRSVAELQDLALNRVRPLFATLPGVSAPPPFGASQRSIVMRVDPERLRQYGLGIDDVVEALTSANTISPSGNAQIGDLLPMVPINSVAKNYKDLESVPIRTGVMPTIYLRDIGAVENSTDITTGYALVNGHRTVYIPVTKRADASTLAVVSLVKENLGRFKAILPDDVTVTYAFDQSPYVTRAIAALLTEGLVGAILAGIMVLLFLRDWRSSLIVVINIPLALLAAVIGLWGCGQTVNIMTLGGLALAVGILVDMSTVVIENIHAHAARGKTVGRAVVDSGAEVALPLLISMLCVVAVFVPAFFMAGVARALFLPLSLAVGFAMVASYLLSSTVVPILSAQTMGQTLHRADGLVRGAFAAFKGAYACALSWLLQVRILTVIAYAVVVGTVLFLIGPRLGQEIFPAVDVGQFQLRLHAPTGTRIERTEAIALKALDLIKHEVGEGNLDLSIGYVGVQPPSYPINTIYLWTSGPEEAAFQVAIRPEARIRTDALKERLRHVFAEQLAGVRISFEPSDIVSRVMSLGSPTPVEIAVGGPNLADDRAYASLVHDALAAIPTLRDLQYGQSFDYPTVDIQLDRERAGVMGVTTTKATHAITAATSSSRFVVPNYWADPITGVAYQVQVEVPQERMNAVEEVRNIPVGLGQGQTTLLRNMATVSSGTVANEYDRYNMQRSVTLTANIQGEDLGRTAARITEALRILPSPPARVSLIIRGQIPPMKQLIDGLQLGLLVAIAVILLLLAAYFQSLVLALIIASTIPAVIAGVALALWLTHTTVNLQSYMGAIMSVGVAVANAILLITFAERSRQRGMDATAAAIDGASSRLRPILMTSLAMIAGMMPMALGLGEGGEQVAPLGRAVVGGLVAATLTTLIVLPAVFALIQAHRSVQTASLDPDHRPDS